MPIVPVRVKLREQGNGQEVEGGTVLLSDLNEFRIAEAVTASSAFPGVFPSVLLDNHGPHAQCQKDAPPSPSPKCLSFQQRAADPFIIKQSRAGEPAERDAVRNRLYIERTKSSSTAILIGPPGFISPNAL